LKEETLEISLTVNGEPITKTIPVRQHLVDFLRTDLGLTGSTLVANMVSVVLCQSASTARLSVDV